MSRIKSFLAIGARPFPGGFVDTFFTVGLYARTAGGRHRASSIHRRRARAALSYRHTSLQAEPPRQNEQCATFIARSLLVSHN